MADSAFQGLPPKAMESEDWLPQLRKMVKNRRHRKSKAKMLKKRARAPSTPQLFKKDGSSTKLIRRASVLNKKEKKGASTSPHEGGAGKDSPSSASAAAAAAAAASKVVDTFWDYISAGDMERIDRLKMRLSDGEVDVQAISDLSSDLNRGDLESISQRPVMEVFTAYRLALSKFTEPIFPLDCWETLITLGEMDDAKDRIRGTRDFFCSLPTSVLSCYQKVLDTLLLISQGGSACSNAEIAQAIAPTLLRPPVVDHSIIFFNALRCQLVEESLTYYGYFFQEKELVLLDQDQSSHQPVFEILNDGDDEEEEEEEDGGDAAKYDVAMEEAEKMDREAREEQEQMRRTRGATHTDETTSTAVYIEDNDIYLFLEEEELTSPRGGIGSSASSVPTFQNHGGDGGGAGLGGGGSAATEMDRALAIDPTMTTTPPSTTSPRGDGGGAPAALMPHAWEKYRVNAFSPTQCAACGNFIFRKSVICFGCNQIVHHACQVRMSAKCPGLDTTNNKKGVQVGDRAPLWALRTGKGQEVSLARILDSGKRVVLFFYPKDFTPGCTRENKLFSKHFSLFRYANCELIGISSDSLTCHERFAKKHKIPFTLLSDPLNKVRALYGVPGGLGGLQPGRVTYVINPKGYIAHMYNSYFESYEHVIQSLHALSIMLANDNAFSGVSFHQSQDEIAETEDQIMDRVRSRRKSVSSKKHVSKKAKGATTEKPADRRQSTSKRSKTREKDALAKQQKKMDALVDENKELKRELDELREKYEKCQAFLATLTADVASFRAGM